MPSHKPSNYCQQLPLFVGWAVGLWDKSPSTSTTILFHLEITIVGGGEVKGGERGGVVWRMYPDISIQRAYLPSATSIYILIDQCLRIVHTGHHFYPHPTHLPPHFTCTHTHLHRIYHCCWWYGDGVCTSVYHWLSVLHKFQDSMTWWFFYWQQDPKDERDEELLKKVCLYIWISWDDTVEQEIPVAQLWLILRGSQVYWLHVKSVTVTHLLYCNTL